MSMYVRGRDDDVEIPREQVKRWWALAHPGYDPDEPSQESP